MDIMNSLIDFIFDKVIGIDETLKHNKKQLYLEEKEALNTHKKKNPNPNSTRKLSTKHKKHSSKSKKKDISGLERMDLPDSPVSPISNQVKISKNKDMDETIKLEQMERVDEDDKPLNIEAFELKPSNPEKKNLLDVRNLNNSKLLTNSFDGEDKQDGGETRKHIYYEGIPTRKKTTTKFRTLKDMNLSSKMINKQSGNNNNNSLQADNPNTSVYKAFLQNTTNINISRSQLN